GLACSALSFGSSVNNCFLDTVGVSCYTQGMFSFQDSLDWGAAASGSGQSGFGAAFSNAHDTTGNNPWLARTTGGVNVAATLGTGFSGGTPILTRADNTYYVWNPACFPDTNCVPVGWETPGAIAPGLTAIP